ncbi:MAG TPA: hypothetical protein VGN72_23545 [Tepidisphaeraceae bacterium]|jgi:GNAT superfamily N-acetyltransferase|nr:hypothetical protein [Tepidisphaeraceae bacterium]
MSNDQQQIPPVRLADLAPGERRARTFDPRTLDVRRISRAGDPLLATGYDALWTQFGQLGEMETRAVIEKRLARNPVPMQGGIQTCYEMILAREAEGRFVGVRDHTAILSPSPAPPMFVVHLSHVLIAPAHRGSGLAGWMRTWPLATAAECAAAAGISTPVPTILVAEMEHPDPIDPAKMSRLIAYEKAGFRKIDPAAIDYHQPDFRDAAAIDADVVRPLPMSLVVRRVGHEADDTIVAATVRRIITSLYRMYDADFRPQDMAAVYDQLATLPSDDVPIALVLPTDSR